MVRVIFYGLVLVNLLFLGWSEWIDVPPAPAPSSIANLPRMTLVSDLPPDKRAALASKMSLETQPPQCVSVGPFDDPAIVGKAATVLLAKGFTPQQRTTESPAMRRFWVYLDGFKTDAGEMRVVHRLEHAGIDDAEAMPVDAGGRRRVSLGLYTDRDKAQRRVKLAGTIGLTAAMTERTLPGTVYWLDLTLPNSSTAVPLKDVSDVEPGGGSSPISVQPCASSPSPGAPSPTAPSPQTGASASAAATRPAPGHQAAHTASSAVPASNLPRCKPGGGGPVPCVVVKVASQPSVL
ncbi:MAG: hypothetical protein WBE91_06390 [Steroidobacteraceae bacterium]